ncbi:MAG: 16S rRNA (uracil(1498)-N(3))-methyltransferase [Bacilli bacterium]|nr:16S rRNA (uracil(1498)-N(3))-methyltransferase [Bacilli bacterium]
MQHYFGTVVSGKAILEGSQAHHLINVKRAEIGEKIEVTDNGETYLCFVKDIDPLEILVLEKVETLRELDIHITVAFALLKGDHNDLIVLKGTELGVDDFVPFVSSRCVVSPKEKEDNRILRLRKIAAEGAAQCRRSVIPSVSSYQTLDDVLKSEAEVKFFAYEGLAGSGDSLLSVAKTLKKGQTVLLVVGPEGGFTHEEARLALDYDFTLVSLGRRILRAETSAIYGASILGAFGEE